MVDYDNMIYADGVFVTLIKDDGDRGRVVQMHNAALAAEREKLQQKINELERKLFDVQQDRPSRW